MGLPILALVVFPAFGPKKLPEIALLMGEGIPKFKQGMTPDHRQLDPNEPAHPALLASEQRERDLL